MQDKKYDSLHSKEWANIICEQVHLLIFRSSPSCPQPTTTSSTSSTASSWQQAAMAWTSQGSAIGTTKWMALSLSNGRANHLLALLLFMDVQYDSIQLPSFSFIIFSKFVFLIPFLFETHSNYPF